MTALKSRLLSGIEGIDHAFLEAGHPPPSGFMRLRQVHGDKIIRSDDASLLGAPAECDGDGLIACDTSVIAVQTADCLPVLLADQRGKAVAAVHAGWRGLNQGILVRAIEAFKALGTHSGELLAAIGPAIGRCCFEVSAETIDAFEKNWGHLWSSNSSSKSDKPWKSGQPSNPNAAYPQAPVGENDLWLDLRLIARLQLRSGGLSNEKIEDAGHCTYCGPGHFASFRRSTHLGQKADRQWSWIGRKEM